MRYLVIATLLLSGAVSAGQDDVEEDDRKRNDCIAVKTYSRMYYQAVTDHSMYVRSGNDHYLVSFRRRCANISDGYSIRFDTRSARVCSNSAPKVAYFYRNIEMPSCRVESIQQVASPQEAVGIASEEERVRRSAASKKREERRNKDREKRIAERKAKRKAEREKAEREKAEQEKNDEAGATATPKPT